MNGTTPEPQAQHRRGWWIGSIWAVPLAALIIVGYLGVRALADRGIKVVVTFNSGNGVKPTDTKVIYQGLDTGHVTAVQLDPDGRHVDVSLSLDRRVESALNSATQFWLVGAQPNIADLASLKAAIAGVTIGMAPGRGGTPTHHFVGLDQPPVVPPGTKGSHFTLLAHRLGSVTRGTTVRYGGEEIGKVTETKLAGLDDFRIETFVYAPYDNLIHPGALFWIGAPLQLSLSGSTLQAIVAPASTVFSGAVDFDLPAASKSLARSPDGASFRLYDTRALAEQGEPGPEMLYDFVFAGDAGDMTEGTPVKLNGFEVGDVRKTALEFDPQSGEPHTAVTAVIYPGRLQIDLPENTPIDTIRRLTDERIEQLLRHGYRASLSQTPPLIGGHSIAITLDPKAGPATLDRSGPYPLIPSGAPSSDFAAIAADVHAITTRLQAILASPEIDDSLKHLDGTLAALDRIAAAAKPQVGPLLAKLNQAADQLNQTAEAARAVIGGKGMSQDSDLSGALSQLTEAARSLRSLTDYLGRHPDAILKGKVKEE